MAATITDVLTVAASSGPGSRVVLCLPGECGQNGAPLADVAFLSFVARQTGYSVVSPRYARAQASLVAAVENLYQAVAAQVGAGNVLLMGYGTGAGLALALTQRQRAEARALPGHLLLLAPWLDLYLPAPTVAPDLAGAYYVAPDGSLCSRQPLADKHDNPLHGNLDGLPRISIFTTVHDLHRADALALARRLFARQQPVRLLMQASSPATWLLPDAAESHDFRRQLTAELTREPGYS